MNFDGINIAHDDPVKEMQSILQANHIFDLFYSHVSLVTPKGKYSLSSREVLEEFWFYYSRVVLAAETTVGLAEVPQKFIPVVVDVDLKFGHPDPQYSEKFVRAIIATYQTVLKEHVSFPPGANLARLLKCAWLNKPAYAVEKGSESVWKKGFHLHFPNLFLDRVAQEMRIIPEVVRSLADLAPADLDLPDILNADDFLDRKAIGNTWLLYGSVKADGMKPYRVAKVFGEDLTETPLDQAFLDCRITDGNEEPIAITAENYQLHYPRIFSILSQGRDVFDINREKNCLREFIEKPPVAKRRQDNRPRAAIRAEISEAGALVKLLKPARAEGHNDWMMVGWALFNVTDGSEEGLDIWINFSSQTPDHDEARCIYEWNRMTNRNAITIGTLKFFAKQDNAAAYTKFVAERSVASQVRLTEHGLASLFYQHCQCDFIYCNNRWYEFVDNFWRETHEGINVKKRLIEVLIPILKTMRQCLASVDDEDESNDEEEKRDRICKAIAGLESSRTLGNILSFCKLLFHNQDFEDRIDKNRYLIGFKNGVFDLKENIFRAGDPSDLITSHMPIDYLEFEDDDERVVEMLNFFEKVFPSVAVRRYFMDVMSEIFVGYNHRKHVYFWTGEGDNGKSITQMFFEKMLGALSVKTPTTLLTSRRSNTGSATAELVRLGNGVRATFLEEPDPDEEIATGVLKSLSGNDSFFARDLYQAGRDVREVQPMFKMFFICNSLPRMRRGGDKASWNRARVIPFDATFTKDAPPTIEEQLFHRKFPVDRTLDQRIPHLVEALAWILMEHRKLPRVEEPPEVLQATANYKNENDIIAYFMKEHMDEDPDSEICVGQMYEYYKEFSSRATLKFMNTMEFEKVMIKRLGPPNGHTDKSWTGYRMTAAKSSQLAPAAEEDRNVARALL